jgi:hypothetical protein
MVVLGRKVEVALVGEAFEVKEIFHFSRLLERQ